MYQTMSPDTLPSSSVRKSSTTTTTTTTHFKSSKEDQLNPENGRIGSTNTLSLTSTQQHLLQTQPQNHNQNHQQEQNHQIGHNPHISNSIHAHETSGSSPSRDVLLQWGQRKRSRCSRTESRSMAAFAAVAGGASDKHPLPPPPPPLHPPAVASTSSNSGGRSGSGSRVRPNNGILYAKDSHGVVIPKNRNTSEQIVCTNGASPSRNGVGSSRPISRSSIGKRSPSCAEKSTDKKASGSGLMRKVKSDDSLGNNGSNHHQHHHSSNNQAEAAEHENNGGYHHHHLQGGAASMARSPVAEAEKGNGEAVEWPRIYISLSRKEKEDDFYAMKGTKLPHRPKKRAKAVDRALQYCFPGLWLSDLTRARYEVRERKSAKKPKRRGLKGLETMESESE